LVEAERCEKVGEVVGRRQREEAADNLNDDAGSGDDDDDGEDAEERCLCIEEEGDENRLGEDEGSRAWDAS
jgi:hypothetical protein